MKLSYCGMLRQCQKNASLNLPRISSAVEQTGLEPWVTARGQPAGTPLRIYTHGAETGSAPVAWGKDGECWFSLPSFQRGSWAQKGLVISPKKCVFSLASCLQNPQFRATKLLYQTVPWEMGKGVSAGVLWKSQKSRIENKWNSENPGLLKVKCNSGNKDDFQLNFTLRNTFYSFCIMRNYT